MAPVSATVPAGMKRTIALFTSKKLDPPEDGRGDVIRNLLEILLNSGKYQVVLISFTGQSPHIKAMVKTIHVPYRFSTLGFILALLRGLPLQTALYSGRALLRELREAVSLEKVDLVIADMVRTSLLALGSGSKRCILDMDDLLSRRYRRSLDLPDTLSSLGKLPSKIPGSLRKLAPYLYSTIIRIESKRMERYEQRLPRQFDATVLISQSEADTLRRRSGFDNIFWIPNFIEFDQADPQSSPAREKRKTILFFGNMSVLHNHDAALYLATRLYPQLVAAIPALHLQLVGRDIPPDIAALGTAHESIEVIPDVPEIAGYIKQADVCLAPLRFGSGVKTKILECLYLGTPVITTPFGAEGIPQANECLMIGETDTDLAELTRAFFANEIDTRKQLSAAQQILEKYFSKPTVAARWLGAIEGAFEQSE